MLRQGKAFARQNLTNWVFSHLLDRRPMDSVLWCTTKFIEVSLPKDLLREALKAGRCLTSSVYALTRRKSCAPYLGTFDDPWELGRRWSAHAGWQNAARVQ